MFKKDDFRFGESKFAGDREVKVLELPYKGGQLSMVVLLPEAKETTEAAEEDGCSLTEVREMLPWKEASVEGKELQTEGRMRWRTTMDGGEDEVEDDYGRRWNRTPLRLNQAH